MGRQWGVNGRVNGASIAASGPIFSAILRYRHRGTGFHIRPNREAASRAPKLNRPAATQANSAVGPPPNHSDAGAVRAVRSRRLKRGPVS